MQITHLTRRDIIDFIMDKCLPWCGRLDEIEFLQSVFPNLADMPSTDSRYANAIDDIHQHRYANYDWPEDWIFDDERLNLQNSSDELFLNFLCQMLHPVIVANPDHALAMKDAFNNWLRWDNYELRESHTMSGRPVYEACRINLNNKQHFVRASKTIQSLKSEHLNKELERMTGDIDRHPASAIDAAKALIESVCKSILVEREVDFGNQKMDLQDLMKLTAANLELVPENVSDAKKGAGSIRKILHNMGSIIHEMQFIRNKYGTGHGKDSKHKGLQPRHASLVAGLAAVLTEFLFETHKIRPKQKEENNE